MTINQLEKELKENKLSSIYLLYGQERYLLDNVVKKIKKSFGNLVDGLNYIKIDNSAIDNIIFMKPNTKKTIPAISDTVFRTPSGSFTKIAPIIMKTSDSNKLSHSAFFKVLKKSIFFTSLSSLLL